MGNAVTEMFAAVAGIVLVGLVFAWFALLPALGLLWLTGVV